MTTKPSMFWVFALPVSMLILAAAYYIKVPTARRFIDAHVPLAREYLGRFVQEPEERVLAPKASTPARAPLPPPVPEVAPATPAPVVVRAKPTPMLVFDLRELQGDRSLWPKKVALKKASNFPAVLSGKVVGSLVAPAGAEANLVGIKDGKIALEYQGGGAWFAVDDTDLAARVLGR